MCGFCLLFCGVCIHVNVLQELQTHPNLNLISVLSSTVTKISISSKRVRAPIYIRKGNYNNYSTKQLK